MRRWIGQLAAFWRDWQAGGNASVWHAYTPLFGSVVMRRWTSTGWQRRSMTAAEDQDDFSRSAW